MKALTSTLEIDGPVAQDRMNRAAPSAHYAASPSLELANRTAAPRWSAAAREAADRLHHIPDSPHRRMKSAFDHYLAGEDKWHDETKKLRTIIREFDLTEEIKWGKPCYSYNGSNVVIIQGFKESCALMFCKGALLKDPQRILEKPGASSQSALRIRFTSVGEIAKAEPMLRAYLQEAIEAEQAGLKVVFKKNPEPVPAELQAKLDALPALKKAFFGLTPGRQRAYILHFSSAKQSATRAARVEKCVKQIMAGKGLDD
jgi:uncharacterized protein YdeI (YjbR/CyaY-like superfamily)